MWRYMLVHERCVVAQLDVSLLTPFLSSYCSEFGKLESWTSRLFKHWKSSHRMTQRKLSFRQWSTKSSSRKYVKRLPSVWWRWATYNNNSNSSNNNNNNINYCYNKLGNLHYYIHLQNWLCLQVENHLNSSSALIEIFKKFFGSPSCPSVVRRNNFSNFQHYFLQKVGAFLFSRWWWWWWCKRNFVIFICFIIPTFIMLNMSMLLTMECSCFSCEKIFEKNGFSWFIKCWFLFSIARQALPLAISELRNANDICSSDTLRFLLNLFKYNDNSINKVRLFLDFSRSFRLPRIYT